MFHDGIFWSADRVEPFILSVGVGKRGCRWREGCTAVSMLDFKFYSKYFLSLLILWYIWYFYNKWEQLDFEHLDEYIFEIWSVNVAPNAVFVKEFLSEFFFFLKWIEDEIRDFLSKWGGSLQEGEELEKNTFQGNFLLNTF